jgi:hypothetical protein
LWRETQRLLLYYWAFGYFTYSGSLNGDKVRVKETHRLLHYRVRSHLLLKRLSGTKSGRWSEYVLPYFEILLPAHDQLSLAL